MITRHFTDVGTRRVHYRKCGSGPALLMVHQSPRSSKEYEALMRKWGAHFTCIAPDSPGFGQSDRLPGTPTIDDFADANIALLDALGLDRVHAYGFHSGGIILVTALKRNPGRFNCLAVGGYAIWTLEEMAIFGQSYLPPFQPSAYGEHLTWLWNRILEQSWVFPWFDLRDAARLPFPTDDPATVHLVVMEMLDSGDAYRAGYGAVLKAPRDIPPPDAVTPPVLISAYHGDPLQAHIDRLGDMPKGWEAMKVDTAESHQALSLDFLRRVAGEPVGTLPEVADAGFVHITTGGFDGLLYWEGAHVDLPGMGLSDAWPTDAPVDWALWEAVIDAFTAKTGRIVPLPQLRRGVPDLLYPDLAPDRFGAYLTRAWAIERASLLFDPWYDVGAATARPIDEAALAPERLASAVRHRLRSSAAKALHIARLNKGDA
jgi:haloalkane dehalogenase